MRLAALAASRKLSMLKVALCCLLIIGAVVGFRLGVESLSYGNAAIVTLNVGMAGALLVIALIRIIRKRQGKTRN